jgi:hypothetical protein
VCDAGGQDLKGSKKACAQQINLIITSRGRSKSLDRLTGSSSAGAVQCTHAMPAVTYSGHGLAFCDWCVAAYALVRNGKALVHLSVFIQRCTCAANEGSMTLDAWK